MGRFVRTVAAVVLYACVATHAHAQLAWGEEYAKRLKSAQTISPMSDDMFGDHVSLFNGTVTFSATDVSLPGNNGLAVAFGRRLDPADDSGENLLGGRWDIDVPHLSGIFASSAPWAPAQRCSTVAPPPAVNGFSYFDYWTGNNLHIGGSSQPILKLDSNPKRVMPDHGVAYKWATKEHWYLSCIPLLSAQGGEGFLARAPDGTKYYFDWMTTHTYPGIQRPSQQGPGWQPLPRVRARLYPTLVEDRFGNWVRYTWVGAQLRRIHSSDAREITIAYTGDGKRIDSVTASPDTSVERKWNYEYDDIGYNLTYVINPDLSRWQYDFRLFSPYIAYDQTTDSRGRYVNGGGILCSPMRKMLVRNPSATIVHPSGATAKYILTQKRHGRTNVPYDCMELDDDAPRHNATPVFHDVKSLVSKVVSGPGIATRTWTYDYQHLEGEYSDPPHHTPTPPPHYKVVTVLNPDQTSEVNFFGKDYGLNEGQLITAHVKDASGVVRQSSQMHYISAAAAQAAEFPIDMGFSQVAFGDHFSASVLRPLRARSITRDGVTFNWQVSSGCPGGYCFDAFARATKASKGSSLGYSRLELTDYHDNLSKWILGQTHMVTCLDSSPDSTSCNSNDEMQKTEYDANAMPSQIYAFGKLQQTLTYETSAGTQLGTLKTVTDGRNNTITLSNWHRGIPGSIAFPGTTSYPSGTTQSAVVDDNGWIKEVTDENGYVTEYGYDTMGRLKLIDYPDGDEVNDVPINWTSTTRNFSKQGAKYGLPPHWRLLETTGSGFKVTRYDDLWRPVIEESYDNADYDNTLSMVVKRYDSSGRLAFQSYPLRNTAPDFDHATVTAGTYSYYDALGRPTRVRQTSELGDLDTTTQYLTGFKTRVVLPKHQDPNPTIYTDTTYQAYDQPTTEFPRTIAQPEGVLMTIDRDALGKPTAITRSGGGVSSTRSYAYNVYHELCRSVEPETGVTLFRYDRVGNLTWSAAGLPASTACSTSELAPAAVEPRTVYRTYDARNRLENLSFPDGNGDQTWAYWKDGLPKIITTWNISFEGAEPKETRNHYTYSKRRLLETESIVVPEWYVFSIGYGYNTNGHLTKHHYPSGHAVTYTVNALGQPKTLTGSDGALYAQLIKYHPNGAVHEFTYGNNIVHSMTQNDRQLPERSWARKDGVHYLDNRYSYDANGNVVDIDDGLVGTNRTDRNMIYDDLDRLTDVTSPMYGGTGAHYTYDALDDLTRVRVGGTAARDHHYCYDARRQLTNVKTTSCGGSTVTGLEYDLQGNLSKKNEWRYVFDYGNRLREVLNVERYRYDAHGRRVLAMNFTSGTVLSHYGLDGRLMYQKSDRTGLQSDSIYLGGSLVAIREIPIAGGTATNKYQHTDALGSPVAVTRQDRSVVERSEYEPFGKVLNRSMHDGPGYTGHVEDAATGMVQMQQRYYDPQIGRFLSVDPVAANPNTGASFNRYNYAANNPYRFTDPDGRDCVSRDGKTTCSIPVTGSRIPTRISFATPPGVSGTQKTGSLTSHVYNRSTPHQKSDKAVQRSMVNDPTPGNDKPATPTGTPNNATPEGGRGALARGGAFVFGDDPNSPVKSYSATDRNGNTWTINVTQPGHGLHFGYVLRGSVDGKAISIGEGWAIPQAVPVLSGYINDVWKGHNQRNIDDAE